MPTEPIPDLLAELLAGRYSYDFVALLIGEDIARAPDRRLILESILRDTDTRGNVLTNILVLGARQVLARLGSAESHAYALALHALSRSPEHVVDKQTDDLASLFQAGPPGA